jgi:hypothetical protein
MARGNGATKHQVIEVPALKIAEAQVKIVGTTPLIVHAFSAKAQEKMLGKQTGKATAGREARDPEAEYKACFHVLMDGRYGFPASGIKECAVRGGKALKMVMTDMRGAFHIIADDPASQLVAIEGEPHMRQDVGRLENGVANVIFRPCFERWSITMKIAYNTGVVSLEQLLAAINAGGFGTGLGDWRPEKRGPYGCFKVASSDD